MQDLSAYFICFTIVLLPDSPAPVIYQIHNNLFPRSDDAKNAKTKNRWTTLNLLHCATKHKALHVVRKQPATCTRYGRPLHVPSSSSLMSLAAWIPSSLSAFSITLLRSRACRSSALIEHPIVQITVCLCACQTAKTRAASQSQACRQKRRSVQPNQPTDDLSTAVRRRRSSQIDTKSDKSSAVRHSDLSS